MSSDVVERKELLASATVDLGPSRSDFFHIRENRDILFKWVSHSMAGVTILIRTRMSIGISLVGTVFLFQSMSS